MPLQGDPLATRITVRIVSVSGLTVAEQKKAIFPNDEEDDGSGGLLEQKDGIEIEINNPLRPVFPHLPLHCSYVGKLTRFCCGYGHLK